MKKTLADLDARYGERLERMRQIPAPPAPAEAAPPDAGAEEAATADASADDAAAAADARLGT